MSRQRFGFPSKAGNDGARRSSIAAWLAVFTLSSPILAMPGGIATPNCDGCHAGGAFDGTISVSPQGPFEPGATTDFVLTVHESQLLVAGFYLTTFGTGVLEPGSGVREMGGELMHQRPFEGTEGGVEIPFSWTAPSGQGGVDFLVAVVAADGNGEAANDRVVRGGFSAVWGCPGLVLYRDIDGDGFGDDADTVLRCESEAGWVETGGDCTDFRDTVWPGATEVANGRDDNCDGEVDEGIEVALLYPDHDGDGFGSPFATPIEGELGLEGYTPNNEDCDDANAETNPDAVEVCDGRDQNCNDTLDEGSYEYCGVGRCLVKLERCDRDCVPLQPFTETCNGLDDDCDGVTDNGDLCAPGEVCDGSCLTDAGQSSAPSTTATGEPSSNPAPSTIGASGAASNPAPSSDPEASGAGGGNAGVPSASVAGSPQPSDASPAAEQEGNAADAAGRSGCSVAWPGKRPPLLGFTGVWLLLATLRCIARKKGPRLEPRRPI